MQRDKWSVWCLLLWTERVALQDLTMAIPLMIMLLLPVVRAGVVVSVRMMSYSNPHNLDIAGACCDPGCARCNYFFKVCVSDAARGCLMSGTTDRWNNINDIVFTTGNLGGGIHNPMVSTLKTWKGMLRINIEVRDYDYWSGADLVDRLSFSNKIVPTAGVLAQKWTEAKMTGRSSSLTVRYSVQCTRNYYDPSCTTYCIPRDDSLGHYTCDLGTGGKVCRSGWHGNDCLVYCIPHDDVMNGHYTCDKNTGAKICLDDWYGPNCKTHCRARNDSSAGYSCDVTGSRVCLPRWYPTSQCETHCIPRNDSTAGYYCDIQTGRKTCLTGWFGPECNCRPNNDSSAAYKCNKTTGDKICYPGWYGKDCDVACSPRNDSKAKYTCNPETGEKECLNNWFGENCEIYCARDQLTTECIVNGTMLCRRHWYGVNCSVFCKPGYDDHFRCHQKTGAKLCLQGWYGEHCDKSCIPHDDGWFGHYNCSYEGTKMCYLFWFGPHCNVFCKPKRDEFLGHYNCKATTGKPVCVRDWYGQKCTTYCRAQDNEEGHYSCGVVDGRKVCLEDWYGVNCTVKCVSRDEEGGHYTCDVQSGQKICMPGWTGESCQESITTEMPPKSSLAPTSERGITTITTSTTPPMKGRTDHSRMGVAVMSDLELSIMVGGFILLFLLSAVIAVIICNRRQNKMPAKPFPYRRQNNRCISESRDSFTEEYQVDSHYHTPGPFSNSKRRTSKRKEGACSKVSDILGQYEDVKELKALELSLKEHHVPIEILHKQSIQSDDGEVRPVQQNGVNLFAKYDDEAARKSNDNVYVNMKEVTWDDEVNQQVDNSLVMYHNPLFVESRNPTAELRVNSRVDPKTGLRDNSDWVAIFNSYK